MLYNVQASNFFKDVKCPHCKEELNFNGYDYAPFEKFVSENKNANKDCLHFNEILNSKLKDYYEDKISTPLFQEWLDKYRKVQN